MNNSKKGFAMVGVILVVVVLIGGVGFLVFWKHDGPSSIGLTEKTIVEEEFLESSDNVSWMFDYNSNKWNVSGEPPKCPDPLQFPSPVDVSLASGLLFPGQLRGGDYKPHGGFRFDNREDNNIEVRAIMDGYIDKISKYEDNWAEQKLLFYYNECGILVMHDHLVDVAPKLQILYDGITLGKNSDSRTTDVSDKRIKLDKGELIATSIGYSNFPGGYHDLNVFLDFGLYDLRMTNGVEYDEDFRSKHPNINEYGTHALCWFYYLEEPSRSIVENLVKNSEQSVRVSDYCKQ